MPNKVLDVPGVRDDFYLNVLDWSSRGPLAIALDNEAYLYTPANVTQLSRVLDGTYISSIKFCDMTVAIGFSDGRIRIYDLETQGLVR